MQSFAVLSQQDGKGVLEVGRAGIEKTRFFLSHDDLISGEKPQSLKQARNKSCPEAR